MWGGAAWLGCVRCARGHLSGLSACARLCTRAYLRCVHTTVQETRTARPTAHHARGASLPLPLTSSLRERDERRERARARAVRAGRWAVQGGHAAAQGTRLSTSPETATTKQRGGARLPRVVVPLRLCWAGCEGVRLSSCRELYTCSGVAAWLGCVRAGALSGLSACAQSGSSFPPQRGPLIEPHRRTRGQASPHPTRPFPQWTRAGRPRGRAQAGT